jgi:hypothetical protein
VRPPGSAAKPVALPAASVTTRRGLRPAVLDPAMQISAGQTVGIGAQANESALRSALAGIAVVASVSRPPGSAAKPVALPAASVTTRRGLRPAVLDPAKKSSAVTLGMRDGTTRTLTLTAAVKAGAANTFAIGADTGAQARRARSGEEVVRRPGGGTRREVGGRRGVEGGPWR